MKAWTDYPFTWLGDTAGQEAPVANGPRFSAVPLERRVSRLVEAYITWTDVRDEPLDLSAAIDAAMQTTPNAEVI